MFLSFKKVSFLYNCKKKVEFKIIFDKFNICIIAKIFQISY